MLSQQINSTIAPWLLSAFAGIIGLMVGSFLNVLIYRLPLMLQRQWMVEAQNIMHHSQSGEIFAARDPQKNASNLDGPTATGPRSNPLQDEQGTVVLGHPMPHEAQAKPFNLAVPRSHCPRCGHTIGWLENIPVVSYILLKGRCSACKSPISIRYPLVELLTGVLFAFCFYYWGLSLSAVAWCLFCTLLLALTGIDWDTSILPDDLTYTLLWAGLISAVLGLSGVSALNAIWGAAAGYCSLWAIYWVFKLITGKEGMGYGDFKLFAALGAWVGLEGLVPVILLASIVGLIFGVALKISKRLVKGQPVPFGPFLALGGIVSMILGPETIVHWIRP